MSWTFGVVLVINLLLLVVYEFVTFRHELHSDSAVKVLLAEEILKTGELFPRDWAYANGDLYAFHGHTFALPLVPLLGAGFSTHAAVGLLVALALLLASWSLLRELPFARWQRLAMLAFLASGISGLMAENLYGQGTYGFIIMMNVAVLAVTLRFVRSARPGAWPWLVLLAVVSALVTWNNPKRAAVMLTAPFLAACGAVAVGRLVGARRSVARLKAVPELRAGVGHLGGVLVGAAAWSAVWPRHSDIDTAGLAAWLGPDAIWRNVGHALLGSVAQLGGLPFAGASVSTGWGVYEALRLVVSVTLLWCVWQALRRLSTSASPPLRFVAVFALASGGLAALFFVFTSVAGAAYPLGAARYLVPSLYTGLLLLPALMGARLVDSRPVGLAAFGAVALTALLAFPTLAMPGDDSTGRAAEDVERRSGRRDALLALLRGAGLRHGYATFWNAGALTVLSEGEVVVRQIELDVMPVPMHFHASNRWFRAGEWSGETFLLLTQTELGRLDRRQLDAQLGPPSRTLVSGDFTVLVYPHELAARLPGWLDLDGPTRRFEVTAASPHVVGAFDATTGALRAAPGEKGELLYGPWLWLAPGRYRASFDVAGEAAPTVATLQLTSRRSAHTIGSQPLQAGPRRLQMIDFELESEEKFVEARVVANGAGSASVYGVTFERLGR